MSSTSSLWYHEGVTTVPAKQPDVFTRYITGNHPDLIYINTIGAGGNSQVHVVRPFIQDLEG